MEPFQLKAENKGVKAGNKGSTEHEEEKEPALFLLNGWMERHEGLSAGFTGRHGGVSREPWHTLNLGLHVGDEDADVIKNRQLVAESLGWSFDAWTCGEQVHGSRAVKVTSAERGKGRFSLQDTLLGCDALVTDVKGVLLTSLYADCVPLYFYDPVNEAIGLAHAGWRGTAGAIAQSTIDLMAREYGSSPNDMLAAVGPAIGACCYEVDGPVIEQMAKLIEGMELEPTAAHEAMELSTDGKARLNLKEINRQIMIKAGILPSRIELSKWCTGCRCDLFYSHRMEGGKTGRMASFLGMAER